MKIFKESNDFIQMRLLTIGSGYRGAKIVELLSKKGIKVNRVPLFKCFAVVNDEGQLKDISLKPEKKCLLLKDVSGFVNKVTSIHELYEGSLIVTSLEDDFGYITSTRLCEKLKDATGEVVITLALVPQLDTSSIGEIKSRIRELKEASDVLLLFEGVVGIERRILKILNLVSLAGEVDARRRLIGEVVVDTSDVFNTLINDGFCIAGYAERKIPFSLINALLKRGEDPGTKTRRMLEIVDEALENLSINGDVEDAKSALIVFAGKPDEITLEGLLLSISRIENINRRMLVRYGDYPLVRARKVSVALLFSGIKRFRFT